MRRGGRRRERGRHRALEAGGQQLQTTNCYGLGYGLGSEVGLGLGLVLGWGLELQLGRGRCKRPPLGGVGGFTAGVDDWSWLVERGESSKGMAANDGPFLSVGWPFGICYGRSEGLPMTQRLFCVYSLLYRRTVQALPRESLERL